MNENDIIELPDDALPKPDELTGDLQLMAQIIGVRLALRVAQVMGGTGIRIGQAKPWLRRYRDRKMRAECDKGQSTVIDLARKYGVSERQAYNILGSAEPDERQRRLW